MVGVSDSRSLLVSDDIMLTGMEDEFLAAICHAKSAGSPLKFLLNHGTFFLFTISCILLTKQVNQYFYNSAPISVIGTSFIWRGTPKAPPDFGFVQLSNKLCFVLLFCLAEPPGSV